MVIWTLERSLYVLCKKKNSKGKIHAVGISQNNSIKLKGSFLKNVVKKFLILDTNWKQIL